MKAEGAIWPTGLKPGDKVRFVSPASTPDRDDVFQRARKLEGWGLRVDYGQHAFKKRSYLAGTDEERVADFNAALRDPAVRAIFATRGGKGSYRIADRLDFEAAGRDPKFLIGFSDITIIHLNLWKKCSLVSIHGSLFNGRSGHENAENTDALRTALMTSDTITIKARQVENTFALTTQGSARGRLIGGNLSMVSTAAGWALPNLKGAILLLEAVNMYVGEVDRQLTMLRNAGHLDGLAGVALGQFTDFKPSSDNFTIVDLLREHLEPFGVPILGGLPLGHGSNPVSAILGAVAHLDTSARELVITRGA
ncbi:muramoyltetrapeptide carboxypeptidase [Phyllobacterium trifolii]|uniref:Muramoyltetrapeptide carboxypeptidase n=1 Tax=Phyllobacterium trifolii TaxID=300193 RepID=A0A839UAX0_9HYPH|nr:LD-carboxypeptidase [Phyllobacterium trifolii]MBB3146120.1 muramoyltetrapeptide carboxypeptidase [Phyllobacterium trifolii]